ncbi:MAG: tRNA lysidine(34) synthetase TilS [Oscillospiraceae bacterium]|nr:tRNA lysidine(34) synthetase TilS [Oscillospiraceae bacterium]
MTGCNRIHIPPEARVLCAVSGGADSTALLHLCAGLRDRGRLASLAAAHFHHGLRGADADEDERFVRGLCAARDIPYFAGRGDTAAAARERGRGLEEAARALRYAFLEQAALDSGSDTLLTAHNADDNLETILLNLIRGAGLDGLCGIPPERGGSAPRILRPLLGVTRAEILAYLDEHGLTYREDESNADPAFTRNRLRHGVTPVLRGINPDAARAAARAAALLRADAAYLSEQAGEQVRLHAYDIIEGESIRFPAGRVSELPPPLASRAVRALLARAGWHGPEQPHIQAVLDICASASPHASAPLPKGWSAYREYGALCVCRLPGAGDEPSGGFRLTVRDIGPYRPDFVYKSFNPFYVASDTIVGEIRARARRRGDTLAPAGKPGSKSVSRLMTDAKIPLRDRPRLAVLEDDAGLIAVERLGVDRSRVPASGANVWELKIEI